MSKRLNEILGVSPIGGTFVRESATKGNWEIRVIEAGEGSSGYYPAEVLERDGSKAFPKGTRMFANHDGWEDMMNGGDIRRLMAKTVSDATYKDGALYADVKVAADWVEFVKEFHEQIGVSINTVGESEFGTIGEYSGEIVSRLENDPYTSIDAVVAPGAGGKFTRMLESATKISGIREKDSAEASADVRKENQVDVKEMQDAIAESNKALIAELLEALKPTVPVADEVDYAAAAEAVVAEKLTPTARKNIFKALSEGAKLEDALGAEKAAAAEYKALYESENVEPVAGGRVVESAGAAVYSMASAVGIKVGV